MIYIVRQDIGDNLEYASYRRGCEAIVSHDNGLTWDIAGKYILDEYEFVNPQGDTNGAGIRGCSSGHTCSTLLDNGFILTAYGHYRSESIALIRWKP